MQYSKIIAATAASSFMLADARPMPQSDTLEDIWNAAHSAFSGLLGQAGGVTDAPKSQVSMYWGVGQGQRALAEYCTPDGPDQMLLSFVDSFGSGDFSIQWLGGCTVQGGKANGCEDLAANIATCQKNGKKVFISIGGAKGNQRFDSVDDAKAIGAKIFNAFGKPEDVKDKSVVRPLGDGHVDGFDINYENGHYASAFLGDFVNSIRDSWGSSSDYLISGAPMNGLPDSYMGLAWKNAKFDIISPQFFNGNSDAKYYFNPEGIHKFGFDAWADALQDGASKDAKVFIGLPSSPNAANTDSTSASMYISPEDLTKMVGEYSSRPKFGGVMLWDAAHADQAVDNGHNYFQQVRCILNTGKVC